MLRNAFFLFVGCMALHGHLHVASIASADEKANQQAIDVLQSRDASTFDKAKACQTLAHAGDKRSVPALAHLLTHPELSNYARQALERIEDPSAAQALRDGLGSVEGKLWIGLATSVGRKRDGDAISALSQRLTDDDVHVAAAAANALGDIGTSDAADLLIAALTDAGDERLNAIARAALKCAQRLEQREETKAAKNVLSNLIDHDKIPAHLSASALSAKLLLLGTAGLTELSMELQTKDPVRFQAVVQTLRKLAAKCRPAQLEELLESSSNLSTESRVLILNALTEAPLSPLPSQIREWSTSPEAAVQAATLPLLARSKESTDVQTLLRAASSSEPTVADTARRLIEQAPDDRFDADILTNLQSQESDEVVTAINLAQRRRLTSATGTLLALTSNHASAWEALGSTIGPDKLWQLLQQASTGNSGDAAGPTKATEAARAGVRIALVRLPQIDCASALRSALQRSEGPSKIYLLERIADVGGPIALKTLEQAVLSQDSVMQDAGSRLLGEWMSPDAAPLLLHLATSLQDPKLQLRSLRGALRIARQLDMPLEQRISICRRASELSNRDEERKLILDIYRQYASPESLDAAVEMLAVPSMREAAGSAIVVIAPRTQGNDPVSTRAALQKVIASTDTAATKQQAEALLAQ